MRIVLIDPSFSDARSAQHYQEDTLEDAISNFWSSVWEQGWNPDKRILDIYGGWMVYQQNKSGALIPKGRLKDLKEGQPIGKYPQGKLSEDVLKKIKVEWSRTPRPTQMAIVRWLKAEFDITISPQGLNQAIRRIEEKE